MDEQVDVPQAAEQAKAAVSQPYFWLCYKVKGMTIVLLMAQ